MITFDHTIAELNRYGDIIRQIYRDKNLNAGYDPGAELQNITFDVENESGNFSIVFHLPEYWKWAENGRGPGKMPPEGSLLKWMEFNQILPRQMQLQNGRTVLPSMKSLEYLIRRKIGRDGTEGKHTWEMTENEVRNTLIQDIKKALEQDFMAYIENMHKNAK